MNVRIKLFICHLVKITQSDDLLAGVKILRTGTRLRNADVKKNIFFGQITEFKMYQELRFFFNLHTRIINSQSIHFGKHIKINSQ